MIPVDQLVLHDEAAGTKGDCMRACIASLMEVPADAVPNFVEHEDWRERMRCWLEALGMSMLQITDPVMMFAFPNTSHHLYMVGGKSPRGKFGHSIIAKFSHSEGYQLVHDPHPSRDGIVGEPDTVYIFGMLFVEQTRQQRPPRLLL